MLCLLAFVLAIVLVATVVAMFLPARRHGLTALLVVVGLLLMAIGALVAGWPYLVTATAVTAVVALGVLVMFQRVPPVKALSSAIAGLVLLFPCVWLARCLGEVFLLQKYPTLEPEVLSVPQYVHLSMPAIYWPAFFCAAALAGLVASRFLDRRVKTPVIFLSVLLLLYCAPQWLQNLRFGM